MAPLRGAVTRPEARRLKTSLAAASGDVELPEAKRLKTSLAAASGAVEVAASGAFEVAASGATAETFDPAKHAGMLGLSCAPPPLPQKPSDKDIVCGNAPALCDWVTAAHKSVYYRLSVQLFQDSGVALRQPLCTQRTPPFSPGTNVPSTFKEPWNMTNCLQSLRQNGLYDGTMTIWQFLPTVKVWNDIDLTIEAVSWQQLDACMGLWSKAALTNSSEIEENQRLIFPGFLPTCTLNLTAIEEMTKSSVSFFRDLPACGGHAVLWSLIVAMHDALASGDGERVMRLYEASVTVTVRMRLNPSKMQVQLDQMSFVDVLRIQGAASGATSFYEFGVSVLRLPEITGQESGPELVKKLDELGVLFKGKKVDRNLAYSILSLVGMASTGRGQAAVRFLERISPSVLADPTKVLRMNQVIKKSCAPDEWQDALVCLMEAMGVAILSGDAKADDFTGDFLVPKARRATGFVQSQLTKRKFCKWFLDEQITAAASGASNALSTGGLMSIKEKCCFPRTFWMNFADMDMNLDINLHSCSIACVCACACACLRARACVLLEWILSGS
jgi:hypothetical protein